MLDQITFNPDTQQFIDKNGNDRKHFKTKIKKWYVSLSINKTQHTVLAHQFIYFINNPSLTELPSLCFKDTDYNNLTIENIVIYDSPIMNGVLGMEGFFRLYFNEKDEEKLVALLKEKKILFSSSKRSLKQKNKTYQDKQLKQKTQGLFPITCGNPDKLIVIFTDQLCHSGPST